MICLIKSLSVKKKCFLFNSEINSDIGQKRHTKKRMIVMFFRMFPVVFSTLLFSAHLLRFYGWWPPIILMLACFSLLLPWRCILKTWQLLLLIFGVIWIKITVDLVSLRLESGKPYLHLLLIMAAIVVINILSLLSTRNRKVRQFYHDL